MQYIVHVSGTVSDQQTKTYVVNSKTEEDAQTIAKESFYKEFSSNCEILDIGHRERTKKAIAALLVMIVPILLSFINWKSGHDTISIAPDYISCLYSVGIYLAFVVRFKGVLKTLDSWIDIMFCVSMVLLLSSFVQTILAKESISVLGLTEWEVDTKLVVIAAVAFSWLGLKIISVLCMIMIAVAAFCNISILSDAMGSLWGPIYVICAFIGLALYVYVEPAIIESFHQLKFALGKGARHFASDVAIAKKQVNAIKAAMPKKDNKNEE